MSKTTPGKTPQSRPAATAGTLQTVTIALATAQNPRQSEPSFLELADGSLLAAWQEYLPGPAGGEDNGLNHLVAMISRDQGRTWENKRELVANEPGDCNVYNCNLQRSASGEVLFVFMRYNQLATGQEPQTSGYICRSQDEGRTFSPPAPIWSRQPMSMASGVLKRLASGRLILPVGRQRGKVWTPSDHEVLSVMLSDDDGRSWRLSPAQIDLPLRGAMEGHVEELTDGRILMVMRTQLGSVFAAHSTDGGECWSKPQTTGLRQPETCPELIRLADGRLLIAWCNAPYDPGFASHYGKRSPLVVATSGDEGGTWSAPKTVAGDPAIGYYNPVAFAASSGLILLAYTETPYSPQWRMTNDHNHLKAGLFDAAWLNG